MIWRWGAHVRCPRIEHPRGHGVTLASTPGDRLRSIEQLKKAVAACILWPRQESTYRNPTWAWASLPLRPKTWSPKQHQRRRLAGCVTTESLKQACRLPPWAPWCRFASGKGRASHLPVPFCPGRIQRKKGRVGPAAAHSQQRGISTWSPSTV